MNVKCDKISSNQIELEIEIPASEMESYFHLAASELSKDMKVKGFRPGKVPLEIVEREKGSQELYNQATNIAIQKTLAKAILNENIDIVGQPEIQVVQIARGNPMKYKAKFWTVPGVELGEYKGLKVKKKEVKVSNEEVDKSLEYLQKSRVKLVTVNRPAKKGDRVEIDFITRQGKVKVEGGESKNHPLVIGEGRFIPGFEKQLEQMKQGEEKEFSLIVPEDWPQKNLAGQALDFKVKVNLVQERQIPELTDDFAKRLGNFKSLDQLKQNIKEGLIQEKETKEKERIRMELIEKIADNSKMDIPQILIDIELDKMINELRLSAQNMGLDFDKYLNQIKKTIDDLKKEWRERAKKRVRIGLVLKAIAKKENIEISEEELEKEINKVLKHYPNVKEAEKNIDLEALKEYTKGVIRNKKVFQLLEREAKII